jgi:hypothetical protein
MRLVDCINRLDVCTNPKKRTGGICRIVHIFYNSLLRHPDLTRVVAPHLNDERALKLALHLRDREDTKDPGKQDSCMRREVRSFFSQSSHMTIVLIESCFPYLAFPEKM